MTLHFLESPDKITTTLLQNITQPIQFQETLNLLTTLNQIDTLILPPFDTIQTLVRKNLDNATKWIPS